MTDVAEKTCTIQKFVGMQLRARTYTVHRADILKVQPWKFSHEEEEGEDEEEATPEATRRTEDQHERQTQKLTQRTERPSQKQRTNTGDRHGGPT